jgi:deoxyribodipyrimidine photolyase-related protein
MKLIILPHQLYQNIPSSTKEVILIEHPYYFTRYKFHKLKLAFHVASMKNYKDYLENKKIKVTYINFYKYDVWKKGINSMIEYCIFDPIDHAVRKEFQSLVIEMLESPNFLLKEEFLETITYRRFNVFYDLVRKYIKEQYSLDFTKLENMDKFNRGAMTKTQANEYTESFSYYKAEYTKYAIQYINNYFSDNFGDLNEDNLGMLPLTHKDAVKHLRGFIASRFEGFGKYQDFISKDHVILNHAHISFLLNSGLLTPLQVLKEIHGIKIPLQSYEGFVRQIIWREYMGYIYLQHYDEIINANFWGNNKKLDWDVYYGYKHSGFEIIDNEIEKIKKYAYAHHIVRLMVFVNHFILTEIDPRDTIKWFMECIAIDAYDWVMQSNILCMGYFSNKFMSKPYFTTSNYLKKMSNYKIEPLWDEQYRKFVEKKKHLKYYHPGPQTS